MLAERNARSGFKTSRKRRGSQHDIRMCVFFATAKLWSRIHSPPVTNLFDWGRQGHMLTQAHQKCQSSVEYCSHRSLRTPVRRSSCAHQLRADMALRHVLHYCLPAVAASAAALHCSAPFTAASGSHHDHHARCEQVTIVNSYKRSPSSYARVGVIKRLVPGFCPLPRMLWRGAYPGTGCIS